MPNRFTRALPALGDLTALDRFKAKPFPAGYPVTHRSFYAPVDDVHGALVYLLNAATSSIAMSMYGFTDTDLAKILKSKLAARDCFVQLTLDSSQAAGAAEHNLLTDMAYPASSVAVGRSEHGAIMHQKVIVIDGAITVTGSTNLSMRGETLQDNQLTVIHDPYVAAEARNRIDLIHAHMLATAANKAATPPKTSRAPRMARLVHAIISPNWMNDNDTDGEEV